MTLIFTDRKNEDMCEIYPSKFLQKGKEPFYRWGLLIFRCFDSMKDGMLAKKYM